MITTGTAPTKRATAFIYLKSLWSSVSGKSFGQASRRTGSRRETFQGNATSSIDCMTSQRNLLVVKLCEPKSRGNLTEWMHNNQVSVLHTSLDFGTTRAIESETKN